MNNKHLSWYKEINNNFIIASRAYFLHRDLRFILIAAQKNYVLDAPLGDRPIAGADADVMNVWQARYDDYLIV